MLHNTSPCLVEWYILHEAQDAVIVPYQKTDSVISAKAFLMWGCFRQHNPGMNLCLYLPKAYRTRGYSKTNCKDLRKWLCRKWKDILPHFLIQKSAGDPTQERHTSVAVSPSPVLCTGAGRRSLLLPGTTDLVSSSPSSRQENSVGFLYVCVFVFVNLYTPFYIHLTQHHNR